MASNPEWPDWLEKLWWREAWLTLEATEPASLPPYLGSTIRGSLGHLLRAVLCEGSGCGHECQCPETCRYFSLFEREGTKPFVLLAPPPPGLEEIAMGGPVNLPYRTGPPRNGESIPTLRRDAEWKVDSGGTLCFGLRLMGMASNALVSVLEAVERYGLALGGVQFRLLTVRDGFDQLLYDRRLPAVPIQTPVPRTLSLERHAAERIRIVFLSPTVFKLDEAPTFSPEHFAARFFEHSIGWAGQMHRACSGVRPLWLKAPDGRTEMVGHRLFHYQYPRHSFRQDKWLDFDGVVGYIDLAGDLGASMPWARTAELLHFGQKATFGLGKVRVLILE
jgi:hypothetical protein